MATMGAQGLVAGKGKNDGKGVGENGKLRSGANGQKDQGTVITSLGRSEVCLDHRHGQHSFILPSIH